MHRKIIAIGFLICLAAPSHASPPAVGKTVSQLVHMLGLDMASATVITEPPAVARGISFEPREGVEVQLFIERGSVPLTFQGGDKLLRYKDLKVIGFRKVDNGKVHCEGEVLWHFKC